MKNLKLVDYPQLMILPLKLLSGETLYAETLYPQLNAFLPPGASGRSYVPNYQTRREQVKRRNEPRLGLKPSCHGKGI